jgi:hypothetical protein
MRKINISADLERRIRGAAEQSTEKHEILDEIISLLDGASRAAGSTSPPGMGFKELVALFSSALGKDFAPPIRPSAGYICKIVNKAKEQGIVKEHVAQICVGLRRVYRPYYSIDLIIYRAAEHYAAGAGRDGSADVQAPKETKVRVFTGRNDTSENG